MAAGTGDPSSPVPVPPSHKLVLERVQYEYLGQPGSAARVVDYSTSRAFTRSAGTGFGGSSGDLVGGA